MWTEVATVVMFVIVGYYFYTKYQRWMNYIKLSKIREMKLEVEKEFKLVAESRLLTLKQSGGYPDQHKLLVRALEGMNKLSVDNIEVFKRGGQSSILIYLIAYQWIILDGIVKEGADVKADDKRLHKVKYLADLKSKLRKDSDDDINRGEFIKGLERDVIRYFA